MITELNGKKLLDVTYDELITTCVQVTFFKFMDYGRRGFEDAAENAIEYFDSWFNARKLDKHLMGLHALGNPGYIALRRQITTMFVDGFVQSGTKGLADAVRSAYLVTLDALQIK